jgi:hypothetical protein
MNEARGGSASPAVSLTHYGGPIGFRLPTGDSLRAGTRPSHSCRMKIR